MPPWSNNSSWRPRSRTTASTLPTNPRKETRDQVVKAVDGIAARRGKAAPEEAEAA